ARVGVRRLLAGVPRGHAPGDGRRGAGGVHDRADGARLRQEAGTMKAVAMGVHVLDVLVRPVESIPEGQGGQLVEQIKVTAAGSAGGAALVLAKLGAQVRSAGAIGTDAAGDMLLALL